MRICEIAFYALMTMAAVYSIINWKDFLRIWWIWIQKAGRAIAIAAKKIWEVMKLWIGKR